MKTWVKVVLNITEFENYQQGDIYPYKLPKQRPNQYFYGGIRIVFMTPRIIEVT
ncbi:hypothetical protein ACFSUS_18630 [Spirosoma soli]|uniref:Uncharacterized protein n=1 Tax=Spirosoma soli TaxID=1770529 RepID=A0ABW5MAH9_9BACT